MDPTITYSALGGSALALAGFMLWNLAKRTVQRSKSEGDLDSRVVAMVDMVAKPLNEIIAEERAEKRRAQDERENITKEFLRYTAEIQKAHDAKVNKITEDHVAANHRLHHRIDECDNDRRAQESKWATLVEKLENASKRLEQLEERERKSLRDAPPAGPATTTIVPVMMPPVSATITQPAPPS